MGKVRRIKDIGIIEIIRSKAYIFKKTKGEGNLIGNDQGKPK